MTTYNVVFPAAVHADASRGLRWKAKARWARPRSCYALRKLWFFSGSARMRLPVAAKIALQSAGATSAGGGSPTPPEPAARHDNALDFRRLGKTHHRIVVEVRLLDAPVLNGDLAKQRGGEAPHDAAFHLLGDGERIDGIARIQRKDDTTHPHVPNVAERHLQDHGLVAPIGFTHCEPA